ncbi:MAG: rhodanese-like domain-containing protein [Rhodospirillales bacterium]|jgi:rhodanese-related sulfurtransferase|nr:rhodanese-like domain-containing protein [Rhodospirillales bacterium]MDP7652043.1 rhodanese-like domain-containing protein [Rhodospirillales bacterium]
MTDDGYAGDVTPKKAWEMLAKEADAVLIDVRTNAEWGFVGIPDLSELGKELVRVPWQQFPTMELNDDFAGQVTENGVKRSSPLLFICRSGQRSQSAALAMTAAGYGPCYNVSDGFEGPPDAERHRGTVAGWKVDGLPWRQG